MQKNKYIVTITQSECEALSEMTRVGKAAAHKIMHDQNRVVSRCIY